MSDDYEDEEAELNPTTLDSARPPVVRVSIIGYAMVGRHDDEKYQALDRVRPLLTQLGLTIAETPIYHGNLTDALNHRRSFASRSVHLIEVEQYLAAHPGTTPHAIADALYLPRQFSQSTRLDRDRAIGKAKGALRRLNLEGRAIYHHDRQTGQKRYWLAGAEPEEIGR